MLPRTFGRRSMHRRRESTGSPQCIRGVSHASATAVRLVHGLVRRVALLLTDWLQANGRSYGMVLYEFSSGRVSQLPRLVLGDVRAGALVRCPTYRSMCVRVCLCAFACVQYHVVAVVASVGDPHSFETAARIVRERVDADVRCVPCVCVCVRQRLDELRAWLTAPCCASGVQDGRGVACPSRVAGAGAAHCPSGGVFGACVCEGCGCRSVSAACCGFRRALATFRAWNMRFFAWCRRRASVRSVPWLPTARVCRRGSTCRPCATPWRARRRPKPAHRSRRWAHFRRCDRRCLHCVCLFIPASS